MPYDAVALKLGGRSVFKKAILTEQDFIRAVRAGLPISALDAILEQIESTTALQREIFEILGSARTIQRKRSQYRKALLKKKMTGGEIVTLSPSESDRLARLARILVRAEEAIGDHMKAQRWLARPNRALGGERPIALLDNDAGSLAVERVLGRIESGVYS